LGLPSAWAVPLHGTTGFAAILGVPPIRA